MNPLCHLETATCAAHSTARRDDLEVQVGGGEQVAWFDQQLADHHCLGAGRSVGDYLRQVVRLRGRPVALLVWGPACYALKDRDLWISWSAPQRIGRLKLLVQNRRFLLLTPKGEAPNLASQTLAAAVRALPAQWQERFDYGRCWPRASPTRRRMRAPVTRRATGSRSG